MQNRLICGAQLREDSALRESFFALAKRTFDIDFAPWHAAGYWDDSYLPYALEREGRIIANVSVSRMNLRWQGKARQYLQIGTVMVDQAFRGQGLCRALMERALSDWQPRCEAVYLYANDSVLNFYPKFGFRPVAEHQYFAELRPCPGDFAPLNLQNPAHLALLRRCYQKGNPFSQLAAPDHFGLLMFYCGSFLKDCVYYSPAHDAICIAEQQESGLLCYDIFCDAGANLEQMLRQMLSADQRKVFFGFTPPSSCGYSCAPLVQEDTTFFLLRGKEDIFSSRQLMLPLLSHA